LLALLGDDLCAEILEIERETEAWAYLEEQHKKWKTTQLPKLAKVQRELGPREGEDMQQYCQRAQQLSRNLRQVSRAPDPDMFCEQILEGLERERPEWAILLQGLRGTFEVDGNIDHALSALRDRLDREEARQPKLLGRATTQAPAVFAARTPAAAQPNTCSVAEQLARLEQQLQEVRASAAQGSSQAAMGKRRLPRSAITQQALDRGNCLRCNSALHKVDQCTAPFSSSGTLRMNTACATSSAWMLDSGCTHDMHSGGGQGAGMFANYQKFDEPVLVHFGKWCDSARTRAWHPGH
jgi:hypothetical protein